MHTIHRILNCVKFIFDSSQRRVTWWFVYSKLSCFCKRLNKKFSVQAKTIQIQHILSYTLYIRRFECDITIICSTKIKPCTIKIKIYVKIYMKWLIFTFVVSSVKNSSSFPFWGVLSLKCQKRKKKNSKNHQNKRHIPTAWFPCIIFFFFPERIVALKGYFLPRE